MIDELAKLKLFQEFRQEGIEEGRVEGRVEGLMKGLQEGIVNVVRVHFPSVGITVAQQQVQQIQKEDELNTLMTQLLMAPDEATARQLLGLSAA
ncbi:MAG TPA: hypothetical protein VKR06_16120 [Ktedonosporobacter sp.]|nr:hypothetical protein [Ktedonosporobacter sp.]